MKELKCPGCGRVFSVNKEDFDSIAEQVKGLAFDEQVQARAKELSQKLSKDFKIAQIKDKKEYEKNLASEASKLLQKEQEIKLLKEQVRAASESKELQMKELISERDTQIASLKQQLLTLTETVKLQEQANGAKLLQEEKDKALEKENRLREQAALREKQLIDAASEAERRFQADLSKKEKLIAELQSSVDNNLNLRKIAVMEEQTKASEALRKKDEEIARLVNAVESEKRESATAIAAIKEQHSLVLSEKMKEIEYYKDFKLRMSTKLIGESLEVHCNTVFNQARSLGLFPNASFGKDNELIEGTKGDFIFRDFIDGDEYVSIMFEMKNEADTTATKHKNSDFLDKLHKDRVKKNCEYAVLVSLLERDNELYNDGIVNVSHLYPNMYVIRPQMFMPLIALICQASRKNTHKISELKRELEEAREKSLDISKFEKRRSDFTKSFINYIEKHSQKVQSANDGIDKIIESLEKQIKQLRDVKAMFSDSCKKMDSAQNLLQSKFTIKSLTHGAPKLREQLEAARKQEEEEKTMLPED